MLYRRFYMMVGLPASGKSTIAAELANFAGDSVILSTDDYIERYAESVGKTYNDVFSSTIKEAERAVTEAVGKAVETASYIIWDQTNLSPKVRQRKLLHIPNGVYRRIAVIVRCYDEEEHRQRLLGRPGKTIPDHIMRSMRESFVEPTLDEGFDDIVQYLT